MVTQELTPGGGRFFASSSTAAGNNTSACNDPCTPSEDCSTATGNGSWDNTHTSDPSSKGERLGKELSTLVQRVQCTSGSSNG
jgi:hypothetical protein